MRTIQAAIVAFDKPFFTYNKDGVKHLPFNVEAGSETTTALIVGDSYFEAPTIEEVMAEFDRLGFVMPEGDTWDFPEKPTRIKLCDTDVTDLLVDVPEFIGYIDMMKETTVKRNGNRYIYLSVLYPQHEAMLKNYQSFSLDQRP